MDKKGEASVQMSGPSPIVEAAAIARLLGIPVSGLRGSGVRVIRNGVMRATEDELIAAAEAKRERRAAKRRALMGKQGGAK